MIGLLMVFCQAPITPFARSEMRVFCIRPCDPGKAFGELWPGYWLMGGFL